MTSIANFVQQKIAETLSVPREQINPNEEFMSLGLDSMHAIFLIDEIEKEYCIEINPHSFWEYPTINSFSQNLEKLLPKS